ncbi:DNA repair protein RecN [Aquimarina rhabdastrellae]
MLIDLSIKNFALIEELQVTFDTGFTTITGETGAGKSLLLGALGLLLGKRADANSAKDSTKKCIIEGTFDIRKYPLEVFFEEEALDYEEATIIRREILPSGKSRAFINDTPVTLQVLSSLGTRLIDIHSQHQTLEVTTNDFQFEVLDALAGVSKEVASYKRGLKKLKEFKKKLEELTVAQVQYRKEYDYNSFLLQELSEAKLKEGELEDLESQYEALNNVEEIQERLSEALGMMNAEQVGILDQLNNARTGLGKVASFSKPLTELYNRIESAYIELDDLQGSLSIEVEQLEADPEQLQLVSQRLQLIHNLQTKHSVSTIKELLQIQEELTEKVSFTENMTQDMDQLQNEIDTIKEKLDTIAEKIHHKRGKALPKLTKELERILEALGMPNSRFNTTVNIKDEYYSNGKDTLEFLFSANKGSSYGTLKKVASGGELSRIMLAIKVIMSRYTQLPTIIFDEIDTGVSGEVARKMADLMLDMSQNLQIFSITHLPQIAAKGNSQYKVYKEDIKNVTATQLRVLSEEERILEIAQMIEGKNVTDTALTHAKTLLNG